MDQIFFIFLLFCFLFLIETKAINLLVCFVGIIVTLAIKLANYKGLTYIEGEYISYILILVQVSALTILFGFLIMLYPTLPPGTPLPLSHTPLTSSSKTPTPFSPKGVTPEGGFPILALFSQSSLSVSFLIHLFQRIHKFWIILFLSFSSIILWGFYRIGSLDLLNQFINYFSLSLLDSFSSPLYPVNPYVPFLSDSLDSFESLNQDTGFLRKLGYYLYSNDNNIFKLLILTSILLLAIVALFFLVSII